MANRDRKARFQIEDGVLAIGPIVFDSPDTRERLLEFMTRSVRRDRRPVLRLKTSAVLPGGSDPEELETLLAEFSDELFVIQ